MSARPQFNSPIGARMRVNGQDVSYFCGTSYYTLHGNPAVQAAAGDAIKAYGLGTATLAGTEIYDELKDLARAYFGVEEITYFASGYLSISVLLQGLQQDIDMILVDAAAHFCVGDAIRAMDKPIVRFNHRDSADLAAKLSIHVGQHLRPAIVTDGVFPSTGAMAPLDDYAAVMKPYPDALLCIDDSHGVGVLGPMGRGSFDHFGLQGPQYLLAGTFSKAFGGYGGFVATDAALAEKIARHAGVMVGASTPPIPAAAAACEGLRLLGRDSVMRDRLRQNVRYLRQTLAGIGIETPDSPVPIICFSADTDLAAVAGALETRGIMVRHVPPRGYSDAPAVETLRIAVFSTHSRAEMDALVCNLGELL